MCSKKNKARILILAIAIFLANGVFLSRAEDRVPGEQEKKGWETLSGILTEVEKSALPGVQSKEIAIMSDDGTVTILIGSPVGRLFDKIGTEVTVTGVYKPSLRVKKGVLPVLEVRFIDKQE